MPVSLFWFNGRVFLFLLPAYWGLPDLPGAVLWAWGIVGFSLLFWLGCFRTKGRAAAGWFAVALAGHACTLQLISAGWQIKLQLFYDWRILLGTYRAVFLLALFLQAALVLWGARRFLWPALRLVPQLFSWTQVAAFLFLAAYSAITIPPEVAQGLVGAGFARPFVSYLTKVALALLIGFTGAVNLILVAAALPKDAWENIVQRWRRADRSRLPLWSAVWVMVVSSVLAWLVLERMPHVPDEQAFLFQAQYMSVGRISLPPPPDPQAFWCHFCMESGGRWYGALAPGWPAALAVGVLLRVPWLVNPVLGAVSLLLVHLLLRRIYNRDVADAAVLLLAMSPWHLFLSASLMSHTLALVLALTCLLAVERARSGAGLIWGFLVGLSAGALLLVRPIDAVIVGMVAGLWWLAGGWRRLRWASVTAAVLAGLSMTALQLAYNKTLTGDPRLDPATKFFDETYYVGAYSLGFGPNVGSVGWTGLDALPGHGPIDVFMNTNQNLYLENFEFLGWPCGSLLFVFLLLVAGRTRRDGLMWGLSLAVIGVLSLFWFSGGPDFGARYWYLMIVPLAALTVRGVGTLQEQWAKVAPGSAGPQRVWAFAVVATVLGVVNVVSWRSIDKYPGYRSIGGGLRKLERQHPFGRSLVFIRGERRPDYVSATPLNPPALDRESPDPIYALDAGPESRERVIRAFADRPVWFVNGPSITKDGFQVAEGPLPPGQVK